MDLILLKDLPADTIHDSSIEKVYELLGSIKVDGCAASDVYRTALWYAFQLREYNAIVEDKGFRYTREDAQYIDWPPKLAKLPKMAFLKSSPGRVSRNLDWLSGASVVELLYSISEIKKEPAL